MSYLIPTISFFLFVSNTLCDQLDTAASAPKPETCFLSKYIRVGPSYFVGGKSTKVSRDEADKRCKHLESHLVYLESKEELKSVQKFVQQCASSTLGDLWTGGKRYKEDRFWEWGNEHYKMYWPWCKDHPHNKPGWDYLTLHVDADAYCFKTTREDVKCAFICEKDE